ncbi:MAG: RDD family protein [Elusimicrobiota bacterium]|jgi:uncharacterized RDD family membrane protein YckC
MEQQAATPQTKITSGAGFFHRLLARAVDMAFGHALGFGSAFFAGIILSILEVAGLASPGWEQRMGITGIRGVLLGIVGFTLYHTVMEGMHGSSVGKMICRLQVVTSDGQRCGMKGAALRNLAFWMDSLFFGAVGYGAMHLSPLNLRFGDYWAKTVVVKARDVPEDARASMGTFILSLFLAVSGWGLITLIALILRAV